MLMMMMTMTMMMTMMMMMKKKMMLKSRAIDGVKKRAKGFQEEAKEYPNLKTHDRK